MTSFFAFSAQQRIRKENVLLKLNQLINWKTISKRLKVRVLHHLIYNNIYKEN